MEGHRSNAKLATDGRRWTQIKFEKKGTEGYCKPRKGKQIPDPQPGNPSARSRLTQCHPSLLSVFISVHLWLIFFLPSVAYCASHLWLLIRGSSSPSSVAG